MVLALLLILLLLVSLVLISSAVAVAVVVVIVVVAAVESVGSPQEWTVCSVLSDHQNRRSRSDRDHLFSDRDLDRDH